MTRKIIGAFARWVIVFTAVFAVYAFTASFLPVAAMCMMVILSAVTWVMNFYVRKNITIKVIPPSVGAKNKDSDCRIVLRNDSILPVSKCLVKICGENSLTGESYSEVITLSSAQKSDSEKSFCVTSDKCGYINLRVEKIYLTDIFGVFPMKAGCSAEGKMSVLPDTFDMNISMSVSYISRTDEDTYSPDKGGNDFSETFQIREYVPGDSLRQIHWKLSDKSDKLMVREASLPISRSLLVFWDKNTSPCTADEMDAMAEVVASLCQALCDEGILFTIGYTDGEENISEEITVADDLFRSIGQMIKTGVSEGISGAERYVEENGSAQFGKVIYIAREVPDNFISFAGPYATVLLCADDAGDCGYPAVTFSPETYITDIQNVEL